MRRPWIVVALTLAGACRSKPPSEAVPAGQEQAPRVVELSDEALRNAAIEVAPLEPNRFSPRLRLPATIAGDPRRLARVGARVPGRVTAIRVKLGDTVRKGEALVEIESVEIHEATLKLVSAQARLRAARDAVARQKQLVAERVGAVADLRKAEADAAVAQAALDEAQEHLSFLGLSARDLEALDRHTASTEHPGVVRAPIGGRVTALDVSIGQVLSGPETIAVVGQLDSVWANLRVYERDLRHVSVGTPVEVLTTAFPDRPVGGRVEFLGDLVDPTTRTVDARASLPNPEGWLRPGMTAVAEVALPAGPDALWVPAEALQPFEGGRALFVELAPRRFEARPVTVAEERGGRARLAGGVAVGTRFVVRGAFALRGELERAALEE